MKKGFMRRVISLILTVLMLAGMISPISFASTKTAITDAPLTAGRSFAEGEGLHVSKDLDKMPKTYEAVVYVPEGETAAGTIFGNYLNQGTPNFNFMINTSGKPYLHITTQDGVQLKKDFGVVIRGDEWVHVVITHDITDSGSKFVCYVNGEVAATASYAEK